MTSRIASASSSRTSGRSATPARSAASRARSQAASRDIRASVPTAGTRTGRRRERRRLAGADAEVSAARGGRQLLPLAVVEVGATAPLHETHHRRDDRGNERQTEQPPEEPSLLLAVLPAHRISLLGRLVHARVEWARLDLNQRPHPYQNHAPRTYSGIPAGAALIRATYLDCAIPLHGSADAMPILRARAVHRPGDSIVMVVETTQLGHPRLVRATASPARRSGDGDASGDIVVHEHDRTRTVAMVLRRERQRR